MCGICLRSSAGAFSSGSDCGPAISSKPKKEVERKMGRNLQVSDREVKCTSVSRKLLLELVEYNRSVHPNARVTLAECVDRGISMTVIDLRDDVDSDIMSMMPHKVKARWTAMIKRLQELAQENERLESRCRDLTSRTLDAESAAECESKCFTN